MYNVGIKDLPTRMEHVSTRRHESRHLPVAFSEESLCRVLGDFALPLRFKVAVERIQRILANTPPTIVHTLEVLARLLEFET
jgi:hypothetical protein